MKCIYRVLLVLFIFSAMPSFSQDGMFQHKKERKKVWRKWRKNRQSYNPYLSKKAKDKPSARIAKGDKKELKRQKRQFKKQLRQAKKKHR